MPNDHPKPKSADPEETVHLLKKQIAHLRRWFERERWKIEPQPRSFASQDDVPEDDSVGDGEKPEGREVRPPVRATGSPEGPTGSGS